MNSRKNVASVAQSLYEFGLCTAAAPVMPKNAVMFDASLVPELGILMPPLKRNFVP